MVQVETTVSALPTAAVADVLTALAEYLPECPHLEFVLRWLRLLCLKHGPAMQVCISGFLSARRLALYITVQALLDHGFRLILLTILLPFPTQKACLKSAQQVQLVRSESVGFCCRSCPAR